MTELRPNIGSYRDRHGKVRWRYRKGRVSVQLPGQPGDPDFEFTSKQAASGLLTQAPLQPSPARTALLERFAREVLSRVKHRAREKDVPFSLTLDEIAKQMEAQDWRCAV